MVEFASTSDAQEAQYLRVFRAVDRPKFQSFQLQRIAAENEKNASDKT